MPLTQSTVTGTSVTMVSAWVVEWQIGQYDVDARRDHCHSRARVCHDHISNLDTSSLKSQVFLLTCMIRTEAEARCD